VELTGRGLGACRDKGKGAGVGSAGVASIAPEYGNKGGRSATGDTLHGGSNIRCGDVFLLSMIAIVVLNSLTNIGNACLIHL
jgi:hypothetical protein